MSKMQSLLKDKINANIKAHSEAKKDFDEFSSYQSGRINLIELSKIKPNTAQPRLIFEESAIDELAKSINEVGLISPISVRLVDEHYEIVAGERRFRAYQKLGKTQIECLILNINDEQIILIALAENLSRAELSDYEVAKAVITFKEFFSNKSNYAKSLGISRQKLYKLLSYEILSDNVRAYLDSNPAILSADTAEQIISLQKELGAEDKVDFDNLLISLLRKVATQELKQSNLIATLKDTHKKCPNSDILAKQAVATRTFMGQNGQVIGKLKQNDKTLTLNLRTEHLTDEQQQAVENLLALFA